MWSKLLYTKGTTLNMIHVKPNHGVCCKVNKVINSSTDVNWRSKVPLVEYPLCIVVGSFQQNCHQSNNRFFSTSAKYSVKTPHSIKMSTHSPVSGEKKLFTPGPLCVSSSVKEAMKLDLGSRDDQFVNIVRSIRTQLVQIAGLSPETHTTVVMQGSGTFSVESVLNSTSDRTKKVLILASGAYGKRMKLICEKAEIPSQMLSFPENEPVRISDVTDAVKTAQFTSVAIVHCETTSGVVSPIADIGKSIKEIDPNLFYIVDGMSSFGGIQADYSDVDFLISSANKCLQGVPGFAFVIAKIDKLVKCKGRSTSLSLDLFQQWEGIESTGQFRFTPPTHCLLAFHQACLELEAEGGVTGRAERYKQNNTIIKDGMKKLGFRRLVDDKYDGHIITSFCYPNHVNFSFKQFYDRLSNKGQLIYPGKVTNADCFRIGNIGHLFPADMHHLLQCIDQVLKDMGIPCPVN